MSHIVGVTGMLESRAFPVFEFVCFLVLIFITVFRRKLSSNDEYRSETHSESAVTGASNSATANHLSAARTDKAPSSSTCLNRISLDENILLNIVVYLTDTEIAELSLSSKSLFATCTSDFLWEQLWMLTFGTMWNDINLTKIREIRGISWNPTLPEITLDNNSTLERKVAKPTQGWLNFYKEFEFCWMDWLMAGCSTSKYCLIGLYGSLYDITEFLPEHPGSAESLTEAAGGDGTDIFIDIGHSSFATSLADMFLLYGAGGKSRPRQEKRGRAPYVQRPYAQVRPTRFQVRMKRDRYFAERLILRDNFLVRSPSSVGDLNSLGDVSDLNSMGDMSMGGVGSVNQSEVSILESIEGHIETQIIREGVSGAINTEHTVIRISTEQTVTIAAAAVGQSTAVTAWPMNHLNFSLGLDTITLPNIALPNITLPKSVLSLAESVFLANAKATHSLKRGAGSRLRDSTKMKNMIPGMCAVPGVCVSHACHSGCKHSGRLRMLYDPIELQWWGWWTCCGMGELAVDAREEEAVLKHRADMNAINYKIC